MENKVLNYLIKNAKQPLNNIVFFKGIIEELGIERKEINSILKTLNDKKLIQLTEESDKRNSKFKIYKYSINKTDESVIAKWRADVQELMNDFCQNFTRNFASALKYTDDKEIAFDRSFNEARTILNDVLQIRYNPLRNELNYNDAMRIVGEEFQQTREDIYLSKERVLNKVC